MMSPVVAKFLAWKSPKLMELEGRVLGTELAAFSRIPLSSISLWKWLSFLVPGSFIGIVGNTWSFELTLKKERERERKNWDLLVWGSAVFSPKASVFSLWVTVAQKPGGAFPSWWHWSVRAPCGLPPSLATATQVSGERHPAWASVNGPLSLASFLPSCPPPRPLLPAWGRGGLSRSKRKVAFGFYE